MKKTAKAELFSTCLVFFVYLINSWSPKFEGAFGQTSFCKGVTEAGFLLASNLKHITVVPVFLDHVLSY